MSSGPVAILIEHGARSLPSVELAGYNIEVSDDDGFIGDRASKSGFANALDDWRKLARGVGKDPWGKKLSGNIGKNVLLDTLIEGDEREAGLVFGTVEDFAQALFQIIRRFLKNKSWEGTEAVVFGGGFQSARLCRLAIGRARWLLAKADIVLDMSTIDHHSDEAGLIGVAHLLPRWPLAGYDGLLAVDIGGTNIRAGVVKPNLAKASDLSKATVWKRQLWRHGGEKISREDAVKKLGKLLNTLVEAAAAKRMRLAPVIGIGCPGIINKDGSIERGAQNLPGNWESSRFSLPQSVLELLPAIDGHETQVVIHNDAVVQGLSQLPRMQGYKKWAVLTIGTGLGNACFTNHE